MLRANAALRRIAAENPATLLDEGALKAAGMTWEDVLSLAGDKLPKRDLWTALIPSMGIFACIAEGTPVWLADGTTAPIEEVVARRLPVLSYDKQWDARPVRYGAGQGPRDHQVGDLVPVMPTDWIDAGPRPVVHIRFVSGRAITATYDHSWIRQRRGGRQSWEWTTSGELRVGDRIPAPLTAGQFGDEGDAWDGYFIGAMLGDGGMTGAAPEFNGDPDDGAMRFMRDYAAKMGCETRERRGTGDKVVRMRFPCPANQYRNPINQLLRRYGVWGKRCEVKALPARPFSLVRNLRNFDDAGVSDETAAQVTGKLTDAEVIARSRMFPFRFLAAYNAAPSLRWAYPLEKALALSLANVPALAGRTLILVDRSGSMFDTISSRSGLNRADAAALFGAALAVRSEHADLVEFGTASQPVQFRGADSVLKVIGRFTSMGGTNTADAVRRHLRAGFHSRVVIITDEQAWGGWYGGDPLSAIPADVAAYTWNLAGYQHGHGPSGSANRHTFGGLSDSSFRMIPALEAGRDAKWPWTQAD